MSAEDALQPSVQLLSCFLHLAFFLIRSVREKNGMSRTSINPAVKHDAEMKVSASPHSPHNQKLAD